MPARSTVVLLLLALAAPAAQAAMYKWVDEKGVTNYSNNPPPAGKAVKAVATVQERISTYPPDPSLYRPVVRSSRQDALEAEWLQRQKLLAMRAAQADCTSAYRTDCGHDTYRSSAYYRRAVSGSFPRLHANRTRASHSFR